MERLLQQGTSESSKARLLISRNHSLFFLFIKKSSDAISLVVSDWIAKISATIIPFDLIPRLGFIYNSEKKKFVEYSDAVTAIFRWKCQFFFMPNLQRCHKLQHTWYLSS